MRACACVRVCMCVRVRPCVCVGTVGVRGRLCARVPAGATPLSRAARPSALWRCFSTVVIFLFLLDENLDRPGAGARGHRSRHRGEWPAQALVCVLP